MKSCDCAAAIALLGLVLVAPGCSSPARVEEMTPTAFEVTHHHGKSVVVSGDGGKATSSFWGHAEIGTDEFVQAVAAALRRSGVFAAVVHAEDADYRLHVALGEVGQESSGFDITAQVSATWTLTDRAGNKVLEDTFGARGTATLGDAFVGTKRVQIVKERAARENIRIGIERLSKLTL